MDFDEKPKNGLKSNKFEALEQESDEENPYFKAENTFSTQPTSIKADFMAK